MLSRIHATNFSSDSEPSATANMVSTFSAGEDTSSYPFNIKNRSATTQEALAKNVYFSKEVIVCWILDENHASNVDGARLNRLLTLSFNAGDR